MSARPGGVHHRSMLTYALHSNATVYPVLSQLQYISFLATCFGLYKTIFMPMITIGRYIQCVHTLWDPIVKVKGRAIPLQAWTGPEGSNRHMKVVRLSALRTGRLYPQEVFLVLISVRG